VNAIFPELDNKYISFEAGKPEINDKPTEGFRNVISE